MATTAGGGTGSGCTLTVLASDGTEKSRSEMTSSVDTYGRESGLSLNGVLLAAFAYDGNGLLAGASFATGERVEFNHDRVTRRVSGLSQTGATWTSANSFAYNARGLVERETLAVGSVSLQRSYIYSDPGFLIQAADAQGAYMYDYDAMGLSTLVQASSEVRVIGPKTDGTVMVGGVPYEYDALGRVIRRGDLSLSYGPDGHLATARRGASEWRYLYDEDGQRIAKLSGCQPVMAYVEGGVLDAGGFTEPLRIGRALAEYNKGSSCSWRRNRREG